MIQIYILVGLLLVWNIALVWLTHRVTMKSGKHIRYINYEYRNQNKPRPVIPDQKKAEQHWKDNKPEQPGVRVKMSQDQQPPEVTEQPKEGSQRYKS